MEPNTSAISKIEVNQYTLHYIVKKNVKKVDRQMNEFEEEIYQKLSVFVEEWNKENPIHLLGVSRSQKLQGACSWKVDFVISEDVEKSSFEGFKIVQIKAPLAIIEAKSCTSTSPATNKQHLDRAFVELYDLKFNAENDAKFYLLLDGVKLDAIHDFGKLFQSIGVNVFFKEDLDPFIADLKSHISKATMAAE